MHVQRSRSALTTGLPARLLATLALLPAVFALPPVPIDETRYLGVAWSMRVSGDWLVPHLNGQPYPDKPPLLFWLLNGFWSLTGVHAWSARLLELLLALACLPLLGLLARRFGGDARAAAATQWLWLGCAAVAVFAGAVMFDMLLALCALAAWCAAPDLARGRVGGIAATALAWGLGVLAKGPVVLLVAGLPVLAAPWWSADARARPLRVGLSVLAALAGAAALALAWALPAARAGGPAYADAIFLHQTVGRMEHSFAHGRPWWWYLPLLPILALPWTFALARDRSRPAATSTGTSADRFALAACVPALLAFCLISGKQPHYLLPLLAAPALYAGLRLADGRWRLDGLRAGLSVAAVGTLLATLGWTMQHPPRSWAPPLWGLLVVAVGAVLAVRRDRHLPPAWAAVAMLAAVAAGKLAVLQAAGPRYDVGPAAARIAEARRQGIPLLHIGRDHGMFTFAGRLREPIPDAPMDRVGAWARAHPDGWVITGYKRYRLDAPPLYRQPFLNRELLIWRAADVASLADAAGDVHDRAEGGN